MRISLASLVTMSLALGALVLGVPGREASAQAPARPPATDRPLPTFTPDELERLGPLLSSGLVSLVEFAPRGEPPAVVLATEVMTPADRVAELVGDPRRYPEFMPALDEVRVDESAAEATSGQQLAYDWTWRTSIFVLRGTHTMQRFSAPPTHPEVGHRFVVRATSGDLGLSRTVWRILPLGPDRSLLMTSSRMDLRDANYLARQLSGAGSTINRTVNLVITAGMVLRTRMEAERERGIERPDLAPAGTLPERPPFDPMALEGLMSRGDVMWIETSGDDLGRVAVIGAMHTSEDVTRAAMLDPQGFTQGLLAGSHARVLEEGPEGMRFEWGIDMPLVGTSGQMRLGEQENREIRLEGVEGALGSARWRFETVARPYGTLVVTWGRFDPSEGLWFLRAVTDADGAFRSGLGSAAQLMLMRGLRSRLVRGV